MIKTFLGRSEITGAEFWGYDDEPKPDDIDELDLFDMLDEEE